MAELLEREMYDQEKLLREEKLLMELKVSEQSRLMTRSSKPPLNSGGTGSLSYSQIGTLSSQLAAAANEIPQRTPMYSKELQKMQTVVGSQMNQALEPSNIAYHSMRSKKQQDE